MPRKAFMADLAAAGQSDIPGISQIVRGPEDGEIDFTYTPDSSAEPIVVNILAADVSEYPGAGNSFFLSTSSHAAPEAVNKALEHHTESSHGMTISALLSTLSSAFRQAYAGTSGNPIDLDGLDGDGDTQMAEDDNGDGVSGDEEGESEDESYYDPYENTSDDGLEAGSFKLDAKTAAKLNERIRHDLQTARQAGFRVGVLSGMKAESASGLMSLSIRISKLGLSDEALQAWDLKGEQYIVLLIRYGMGYKTFNFIMDNGVSKKENGVEFRVGLCNRYKPTVVEGMAAFSEAKREASDETHSTPHRDLSGFSSLFISSSLNDFMNKTFMSMMKYRGKYGVSWDGAKQLFNTQQGSGKALEPEHFPDEYYDNDMPKDKVLPEMAQADHLNTNSGEVSFPLIAMQFVLRYFIRCPEFCLICHDKTTETFEALKPYVCSRGLCLFQYMQLGFGPSIEHEIITQPYVVDLLISFCYAAARTFKLRSYPLGQFILVPPRDKMATTVNPSAYGRFMNPVAVEAPQVTPENVSVQPNNSWKVKFDAMKHEVIFDDPEVERGVVSVHEWVVVDVPNNDPIHYRVVNVSMFPTIQLSETGISRAVPGRVVEELYGAANPATTGSAKPATTQTPVTTPPASYVVAAQFSKYDRQFDHLADHEKSESIVMLLETLPKVTDMREYLLCEGSVKEPRLSNWTERITQPALTLLRWIISSNRSIICQVDSLPGQAEDEAQNAGIRLDQKVLGMDNWMQFRFAQGAPDKEQRFVDSLTKKTGKLNPKYPTLFAWHGSALHNWHSIIRSGLDYKDTINGRAYGHGCYFAQDLNVSTGYSGLRGEDVTWPGSQLQISTALAMAEIVNAPDEYVSKNPYIVVQHVDWIQCRYLFVNKGPHNAYSTNKATKVEDPTASSGSPSISYIEQDPSYQIKNAGGQPIQIPARAIASRKAMGLPTSTTTLAPNPPPKKKLKSILKLGRQKELPSLPIDGYKTDETDADDVAFFKDEPAEPADSSQSAHGKRKVVDLLTSSVPKTDFVPNTLDPASLQLMADPSYATSPASMQLSRALKAALKTQKDTPLHELGWSIDERFTENLYQWIVELHSFEDELPLAEDMKQAGVKSVVLEMRFGKNFPYSPPFVRVIRPRFLPFMNGGGGHVTAGGALCMELLTSSGWSAVNTIESVLMQVRLAMSSLEPKPARMQSTDKKHQSDYGVGEAMEAFIRACNTHGWDVPSDFTEMRATASGSVSGYSMF